MKWSQNLVTKNSATILHLFVMIKDSTMTNIGEENNNNNIDGGNKPLNGLP